MLFGVKIFWYEKKKTPFSGGNKIEKRIDHLGEAARWFAILGGVMVL